MTAGSPEDALRELYLRECPQAHTKAQRLALFKKLQDMAEAGRLEAWARFAGGMSAWVGGDFEEALTLLEEAIQLDREFAFAWNGKGNALSSLKRYDEALAAYDKAIQIDPEYAVAWSNKGNALGDLKRYDEALAAYDKAIQIDPEDALAWSNKGSTLGDLKRYDEALAAYDKAIQIDPEDALTWNGKGYALHDMKRHDEALAAYDKAIQLDPEDAAAWLNKGDTLRGLKRHDEALAAYDKAIQLDPEDAGVWNNMGIILDDLACYEQALAAYDKAIQLAPEAAEPHYNAGLLHWHAERFESALKEFRLAAELDRESPAKYWLARVQERLRFEEDWGKSPEESDREDRSSDAARLDLYEALRPNLDDIGRAKVEFRKQIDKSVGTDKKAGQGAADDLLLVLRDWNSFSPILRRELRKGDGPGPDERLGGGYLLVWKGCGVAIDPGADFITQLYRKGLSVADVDAVTITHCHLDHTRDVESLVDLNYRYNQARRGRSPKTEGFRDLKFFLSGSAETKYKEYLRKSGCCQHPVQLGQDPGIFWPVKAWGASQANIKVRAVPAQHRDVTGDDDESIGLVFVLSDGSGPVLQVGFTSDTRWNPSLNESFLGCDLLVAHLGTIEVGERKTGADAKKTAGEGDKKAIRAGEKLGEYAKEYLEYFDQEDKYLENHLGTKGCHRLLQDVQPTLLVLSEFGEELVQSRLTLLKFFNGPGKPQGTRLVLGGDSNLAIKLGKELSVCCSHPECAHSWSPIPLDRVRPVLGDDYLFRYYCSKHSLVDEVRSAGN